MSFLPPTATDLIMRIIDKNCDTNEEKLEYLEHLFNEVLPQEMIALRKKLECKDCGKTGCDKFNKDCFSSNMLSCRLCFANCQNDEIIKDRERCNMCRKCCHLCQCFAGMENEVYHEGCEACMRDDCNCSVDEEYRISCRDCKTEYKTCSVCELNYCPKCEDH